MSNPLNIIKELGDYALHQQQAADALRDKAATLIVEAERLRRQANEADERSTEALADATALRDRRRAPSTVFSTDTSGVTVITVHTADPITRDGLVRLSERMGQVRR